MVPVAGLGLGVVLQYYFATPLGLKTIGASMLSNGERPDLQRRVTALAQQADVPVPDIAVSDTEMSNAFATGRSPLKRRDLRYNWPTQPAER